MDNTAGLAKMAFTMTEFNKRSMTPNRIKNGKEKALSKKNK